MKNILLISAFSFAFILSACSSSSDDAAQIIADEFVTISGQTTNLFNVGESGVTVAGVYGDPGGLLDPSDTSAIDGSFSLQVIKGSPFSLRATKSNFATVNSVRGVLSVDQTSVNIAIPTEIEVQKVITLAFTATTPIPTFTDADKAWLAVDVIAANGVEANGAIISPVPAPNARVYTDCSGADVDLIATKGPCLNKSGPMYIAYFTAPAEILVTVGGKTLTAPVRMGEITVLTFVQ